MDFGLLPPEVNSNRMFRGPGSESLRAAAEAWEGLGKALYAAEVSLISVVSGLGRDVWQGPSATSMAEAIRPHLRWIGTTARLAHHTAAQASSAFAAYEAALMATVMPTQVTQNRDRLRSLAAVNQLAQFTTAIATVESLYIEMWVQDAQAMYRYARQAAQATRLVPFPTPGQIGTDAQLYCAVPQALDRLAAQLPLRPTPQPLDPPSPMSVVSVLISKLAKPDNDAGRRPVVTQAAAAVGELSVPLTWVTKAPNLLDATSDSVS